MSNNSSNYGVCNLTQSPSVTLYNPNELLDTNHFIEVRFLSRYNYLNVEEKARHFDLLTKGFSSKRREALSSVSK